MSKKRTIAVVTSSRADYAHLFWPLKHLLAHPEVDPKIIALGPHLSPEFGYTVKEIEADGFPIVERIECLLSSDSDVGMAKTIGIAILSLADALARIRPDLLMLIADRYEMLAPAAVAVALRIPMVHVEGGEISEGAIDDAVRNALTKLSHIHLTPTEGSRLRVMAMGEESWRVHRVGAPSLDHLYRQPLPTRKETESTLSLSLDPSTIVVAFHPVTLAADTNCEADSLFAALEHLSQEHARQQPRQFVFCYPNADAGSRNLIERIQSFCATRENAHLFINLPTLKYWGLLKCADLMIGNSSSGIMETPSLQLPTVNIGIRQQGRERARNVLDAAAEVSEIIDQIALALSPAFAESLEGMTNPYGDGRAAERITQILTAVALDERLLRKRHLPIERCYNKDQEAD